VADGFEIMGLNAATVLIFFTTGNDDV